MSQHTVRLLRSIPDDARFLARKYVEQPDYRIFICPASFGREAVPKCAYCLEDAGYRIGFEMSELSEPALDWVPACRRHTELLAGATKEAIPQ